MKDEFVSEPIKPVEGTFDTGGMTRGEPGLPGRFIWRDKEYIVAEVLTWRRVMSQKGALAGQKDHEPPASGGQSSNPN